VCICSGLNQVLEVISAQASEAIQWQHANPVRDPTQNVFFLTCTEGELYKTLLEASKEAEGAEKEKLLTSNWTGNPPWCVDCTVVQ
jgi:hypothetical protein